MHSEFTMLEFLSRVLLTLGSFYIFFFFEGWFLFYLLSWDASRYIFSFRKSTLYFIGFYCNSHTRLLSCDRATAADVVCDFKIYSILLSVCRRLRWGWDSEGDRQSGWVRTYLVGYLDHVEGLLLFMKIKIDTW